MKYVNLIIAGVLIVGFIHAIGWGGYKPTQTDFLLLAIINLILAGMRKKDLDE